MNILEKVHSQELSEKCEEKNLQKRSKYPLSRERLWDICIFGGILLLGAILRFWALGDKPLHHDESLHAYYALQLMNSLQNYHYDPLTHGPFQFHAIALVYKISSWLGAPDYGVNTTTVRIAAATLGTVIVGLPYFLRDYLGRFGAALACLLLAISPSMVYFSRFAREDIYMACFTMLLVVAIGRYIRSRRGLWLIIAAAAFSLSYATKEATFLTIAIFGSFFGALVAWEIGSMKTLDAKDKRYLPKTWAPLAVAIYFLILLPIAKILLNFLKNLSIYLQDPKNQAAGNKFMSDLKDQTVYILPRVGIVLSLCLFAVVILEIVLKLPTLSEYKVFARINAKNHPLLHSLLTMRKQDWLLALVCACAIFLVLFTVLFTNVRNGIGDGIWQGLYYWIIQQQVARGGQPWYYYLMLFPLYELLGVIFGIIGIIVCLRHPSRFRLFLIYWFIGNFFIYSWAGEKMPWLMIHMTMPLLLLASIGLQTTLNWMMLTLRSLPFGRALALVRTEGSPNVRWGNRFSVARLIIIPVIIFLIVLDLQNMFQMTYVHPADGPHEMMIYVQTTTAINTEMAKIDALDQKYDHGQHELPIGVTEGASWPFYWYLRDYRNVCYGYPVCSNLKPAVIISATDSVDNQAEEDFATSVGEGKQTDYQVHRYPLRSWWDEGYKPVQSGGVGLFTWLSYGDTPPTAHAPFDLGRAARNIWLWWWQRQPFGSTMGSTDIYFLIRNDLGMQP